MLMAWEDRQQASSQNRYIPHRHYNEQRKLTVLWAAAQPCMRVQIVRKEALFLFLAYNQCLRPFLIIKGFKQRPAMNIQYMFIQKVWCAIFPGMRLASLQLRVAQKPSFQNENKRKKFSFSWLKEKTNYKDKIKNHCSFIDAC